MNQIRSIFLALFSAVCGGATVLAVTLPPSPFQQGVATVANVCQANGFPAAPTQEGSNPASPPSITTPSGPTLPQLHGLPAKTPSDPGTTRPYGVQDAAGHSTGPDANRRL